MNKNKKTLILVSAILSLCVALISVLMLVVIATGSKEIIRIIYESLALEDGVELWVAVESYQKVVEGIFVFFTIILGLSSAANIFVGTSLLISLKKASSMDSIRGMVLACTIISFLLGGSIVIAILLLVALMSDSKTKTPTEEIEESGVKSALSEQDKIIERVKKIKELKDSGAITEDEYKAMLKQILL